jgi:O-antigen ligase
VNGTPIQWIFGKGGSIADVSQNLGIIDFAENEPHNDYIRVLHAYGLVGIFLYLSILAVFFRTSLRLKEFGNQFERGVGNVLLLTLIGFTVLSVTLEPLRYPTGCWYLFALGSIVVTLWSRRSSQRVLQVEAVT